MQDLRLALVHAEVAIIALTDQSIDWHSVEGKALAKCAKQIAAISDHTAQMCVGLKQV